MARKPFSDEVRKRKREEILDAAMLIFEKHGKLEALSFRNLAPELGLSYSAPYRYFESKDELINAMRARAFRWIEQAMQDAIRKSSQPEQQLELLAKAYIENGLQRPHRYALMFFELDDSAATKKSLELRTAKRDALDVCTRVIAAGQDSGAFPDTIDPLTASHLFWVGAHGLISLQVAGQLVMGRDIATLVPILIHSLMMGMEHYNESPVPQMLVNA